MMPATTSWLRSRSRPSRTRSRRIEQRSSRDEKTRSSDRLGYRPRRCGHPRRAGTRTGRSQLDDDQRRRAAYLVGQERPEDLERERAETRLSAALENEARESTETTGIVDAAASAVEHHFLQGIQGAGLRRRQLGQRLLDRLRPQQDLLETAPERAAARSGHPCVPRRDDDHYPRHTARPDR